MPPAISSAEAPVPVRGDLALAQRRALERLAAPGTWWSGAERVAIAAEARQARRCGPCRERRQALSPAWGGADHESLGRLPPAAVEAIHRVAADPGRLSRAWFEKTRAAGLAEGPYVELVGVVATLVSLDAFCRGLGVAPHPLPEPLPGEPSRYRPGQARDEGAFVPMIPARGAQGAEADLWPPGRTANVLRALSLVPDEVRGLKELSAAHYLPMEQVIDVRAHRLLSRAQMELVAARVSALNECHY